MGAFNFEYSDLVMRIGKLLLLAILLIVVFLFSPPSIMPTGFMNLESGSNSLPKNASPTK